MQDELNLDNSPGQHLHHNHGDVALRDVHALALARGVRAEGGEACAVHPHLGRIVGRAQVQLGERASIIFMMPRAFDLIWNGSERITR